MKPRAPKRKTASSKAPAIARNAFGADLSLAAAAFILVLSVAVVYANSLGNGFVFDDAENIVANPHIRSLAGIPRILGLTGEAPLYRPLRHLSYTIDFSIWGLNPIGYHLANLGYHAVAAVLVFALARSLLQDAGAALLTALIFAVHPVQTDAVTYLSGRRDVLCGLFYLLGFWAFLNYRKNGRGRHLLLALGAYAASVASKEMGVTLPALFLVHDLMAGMDRPPPPTSTGAALRSWWRRHRWFYAAFFMGGGAYAAYTILLSNPSHAPGYHGGSLLNNFLTVAKVQAHYLKLLGFPRTLNADYSYNAFPAAHSILEPAVLVSLLALFALLGGVLWLARRDKLYLFCWLWFVVTLLPVSQIIPHHELLAEHYLYLPLIGFALAAARAAQTALRHPRWRHGAVIAAVAVALVLLAVRTTIRNRDWRDDLTLWTKTVATAPECARARNNLGRALTVSGRPREALDQLRAALRIKPRYPEAYANLGVACGALGLTEQARGYLTQALALNPQFAEAHYNLGVSHATAGDLEAAAGAFTEAVRLNPGSASARFNLALALIKLGRPDEAREHLQQVLALAPEADLEAKTRSLLQGLANR